MLLRKDVELSNDVACQEFCEANYLAKKADHLRFAGKKQDINLNCTFRDTHSIFEIAAKMFCFVCWGAGGGAKLEVHCIAIQSSKAGIRGRDAPWRHKLDLSLGSGPKKPQVSPSLIEYSPSPSRSPLQPSPLLYTYARAHIRRHSWQLLPKHIHTSHHCSTHGSLYQHDWKYRETHTELLGETVIQFLPVQGPLLANSTTYNQKGYIHMENSPSYQNTQIKVRWSIFQRNVCTNVTLLAQRIKSLKIEDS